MQKRKDLKIKEDGHDAISSTMKFWERRYGQPLSREEARQIIEMMTGFFSILQEWDTSLQS
ncbi:hypothetical protein GMST_16240 [Geomonas silvestris]|uniref:Uncharacterized protein n=1 Tax=Geomonas silvestris TaxID=2740184 RepID=A0A6V8MI25_9BACT|nr:hypothetical protein [Geomonas silvestris]GFO59299.1 hypothetical protein GMST_16240 [Geomonas silvestris]